MFNLFATPPVEPWKPVTLSSDQWPPNYEAVYKWRVSMLRMLKSDAGLLQGAIEYYRLHRKEFVMHWCDTYDPRRKGDKWIPFVFFEKQSELWDFLDTLIARQNHGLIEKARDMGATWVCVGWSVTSWLFEEGIAIGWGSRKQELVDRIGDASSIFEKIRLTVRRLPRCFRPKKYDASQMKMINHDNGATIIGEIGDNIGRGGRTSAYFKDESAHYEHPEAVEGALGDNTNVMIDISSVNGPGNVFHRKREAGVTWPSFEQNKTSVFVMDWSDHPEKTAAWHEARRARYEAEGLLHVFATEVDRNYFAAVQNTVIDAKWIDACFDLHKRIPSMFEGGRIAGFDVADEGLDKNAYVSGKGRVTDFIDMWGDRDTGVGARRAIGNAKLHKERVDIFYDSVGVGSGVKSEYNRLREADKTSVERVFMHPWNAGGAVQNPAQYLIDGDDKTPMNEDFFYNVKAQAWWNLRNLFRCTWEFVNNGMFYPIGKLLSIDTATIPPHLLLQLKKELVQPVYKPSANNLKMVIDKKPEGVASPNIADALVMRYFPIWGTGSVMQVGKSGWL